MLGKNYLTVNNTAIPNPVSFDYSFEPIENLMTSESGKDLVVAVRLNKRTFRGTWHLSSFWLPKFEAYASLQSVTLVYQGTTYYCRARGFAPKLVENSERTSGTNGLWEVSMEFIEL